MVLKCLLFDDKKDELDKSEARIEYDWGLFREKDSSLYPMEIESVGTYNQASEIIKTRLNEFDVFVCDLLVSTSLGDLDPEGLRLIEMARHAKPTLAIIALSQGVRGEGFPERTKELGADSFIEKGLLLKKGQERRLGQDIRKALENRSTSTSKIIKAADPEDLELGALFETVDAGVLEGLARGITPQNWDEITVGMIRPGLSGASVLKIDYSLNARVKEPSVHKTVLMKLSQSRAQLDKELQNYKTIKKLNRFPSRIIAPFENTNEVVTVKEWHALATEFLGGAYTLLDWLVRDDTSADRINQTLGQLFSKSLGLGFTYAKITWEKDTPVISRIYSDLLSSKWRIAKIKRALEDYRELASKYSPSGSYDPNLIDNFITARRIVDLDEEKSPRGVGLCWNHGDLHARNVLVQPTGISDDPYLIDPANINVMHWAADLARLSVDLIVSGLDSGTRSHEWEYLGDWFEISREFLAGRPTSNLAYLGRSPNNRNVAVALDWITRSWPSVYDYTSDTDFAWHFRLACAVELMRSSYRQFDLTAPKRVLGLVAACEALRETGRLLHAGGVSAPP